MKHPPGVAEGETMNLKIESKKENALMGRQEITFSLRHDGETTRHQIADARRVQYVNDRLDAVFLHAPDS